MFGARSHPFWRMGAALIALGILAAQPVVAETPDYTALFKTKALKCIHPTVNVGKATYEVAKGPDTAGEITTVRFKVFYAGLVGGKNAMDADLMIRQAGSIRQMKVNVLSDTGSSIAKCPLTAAWTDF